MNETDNKNLELRVQVPAKPNESGRLEVQDFVRIYDPQTKEIMLEKRS